MPLCAPKSAADSAVGDVVPSRSMRRFGVRVEAQTHGDAGAVRPRLRRELPSDPRDVDRFAHLTFRPLRPRLIGPLLLLGARREDHGQCKDTGERAQQST